jgi:hypothetical protein
MQLAIGERLTEKYCGVHIDTKQTKISGVWLRTRTSVASEREGQNFSPRVLVAPPYAL